ncbi:tetratricopeptide repeat protein [Spirosoma sp. KUDC1026]|uniref:tetratricopeptide repeat protein n=1 Tax=Spirosoma sp. KUDC1026 TaxID=2745947 RepID=UPI00159BA945|nr:tetratricopeptide repeat protein [Spirosoma sp. KUDC1026]QKZ13338.1 tetratricopeptide repeat protein [Spirosoma sp. KUDC1026]
MLEFLVVASFVGYIIYLRYYADQRTEAEKEVDRLHEGVTLFDNQQYGEAIRYFTRDIQTKAKSPVAFLYRARCYRAQGDITSALSDLNTGKSYDDTITGLHLESGKIHFSQQSYDKAFNDFDKAVFYSQGTQAEPFRWRSKTRQHLNHPEEARQDLTRAEQIEAAQAAQQNVVPVGRRSFFDRQFTLNAGLVLLSGIILLIIIKASSVIHWPYLWAASSAMGIGFLEPRKGWSLAILQTFVLLIGYYVVLGGNQESIHRDVQAFSLFGSIGLTFVGSFIGSMLRKTQA